MSDPDESLQEQIIEKYMEYVSSYSQKPDSLLDFIEENNFDEDEFTLHFTSFKQIDQTIFELFCSNTLEVVYQYDEFESFSPKDKLLTFYYTFFENLNANSEYIEVILNGFSGKLKSIATLKKMRKTFQQFVNQIGLEKIDLPIDIIKNIQERSASEWLYGQLLLTIEFWLNDTSKDKERTDAFIEKSMQVSYFFVDVSPLKNVLDLGRFFLGKRK